jgi:hypothetical protein
MSSGVNMSVTRPNPLCKWNLVRCPSSDTSDETYENPWQRQVMFLAHSWSLDAMSCDLKAFTHGKSRQMG